MGRSTGLGKQMTGRWGALLYVALGHARGCAHRWRGEVDAAQGLETWWACVWRQGII